MTDVRILIVEDDRDIAQLIALHLREADYQVELVYDGEHGLEQATSGNYDLIVLDVVLPKMSGTVLCQRLRAGGSSVLILMLTARSGEFDRVLGLELGADDYLTKPFGLLELQARIKALLRRRAQDAQTLPTPSGVIRIDDLTIDAANRTVVLGGRTVNLTLKEFDLLLHFAQHPGKVYTRSQLLDLVWGYGYGGLEHTVNSHINRLRTKLECDPANPVFIQTVWGVGYRFSTAERVSCPDV